VRLEELQVAALHRVLLALHRVRQALRVLPALPVAVAADHLADLVDPDLAVGAVLESVAHLLAESEVLSLVPRLVA
jgi:hypothetical protein